MLGITKGDPQFFKTLNISIVAEYILESVREPLEHHLVNVAVAESFNSIAGPTDEIVERHILPRDANNRNLQRPSLFHGIERRKYFPMRKVSRHTEDDQRIGLLATHGFFSAWPPN